MRDTLSSCTRKSHCTSMNYTYTGKQHTTMQPMHLRRFLMLSFASAVHIQWSASLNLKSNQAASDYPTCQWTFLDPSSTCSSSTSLIRINLGVPPNATALVRDSSGIIVVNNPVRRPCFLARVALGGTLRFSWFKFIKQELISMFTKWKEKNSALLQWVHKKKMSDQPLIPTTKKTSTPPHCSMLPHHEKSLGVSSYDKSNLGWSKFRGFLRMKNHLWSQ